jgi:hypothetical protein
MFEAAGNFIIDEKGKLSGGVGNDLYFKLTTSGFVPVDISQIPDAPEVREFMNLDLDNILHCITPDFEKWIGNVKDCISQVDHVSKTEELLYAGDGVSKNFQDLIDFIVPHELSPNLLNDTKEYIDNTLNNPNTIRKDKKNKNYVNLKTVQEVMSFLEEIDTQIKFAIDGGLTRKFVSFLKIAEEDDELKLYSPVIFTFDSDSGLQAVDETDLNTTNKSPKKRSFSDLFLLNKHKSSSTRPGTSSSAMSISEQLRRNKERAELKQQQKNAAKPSSTHIIKTRIRRGF